MIPPPYPFLTSSLFGTGVGSMILQITRELPRGCGGKKTMRILHGYNDHRKEKIEQDE